jgi:hypothetical protein
MAMSKPMQAKTSAAKSVLVADHDPILLMHKLHDCV